MIDIHPPHQPVHTWKDFLIHMSAICLGLLIAIGLEQSVEYIHQRRELRVARDEMRAEIDDDNVIAERNMQSIHDLQARLNSNMALLLAHRGTDKPLTGKLDFTWSFTKTRYAALKSTLPSGVLSLMPHRELEEYDYIYAVNEIVMIQAQDWGNSVEVAKAIASRSPDGQLSPQDTNELITAISQTQGQLAFTERLISFAQADLKQRPVPGQ